MNDDTEQRGDVNQDAARTRMEELVAACIELVEEGNDEGVEALLAAARDEEGEAFVERARHVLKSLHDAGMVGEESDSELGGRVFGEYRLLQRLGAGGMGTVYLARQESLGRLVAIKVARAGAESEVDAERFRREARAVASLRHPNIVPVYGVGEEEGRRYLAMEYIPGESLADWMRTPGRATIPVALDWMRQIALALLAAHDQGIVHRDVKPRNILIDDSGRPMLVDFGLAREADADELTRTGHFVGSPMYASPEQIRGDATVGPSSDVYSLGVTLFELVVGRAPFVGDSTEQLFHRVLNGAPLAVRRVRPELSKDLATVIHTAIERDSTHRYPSAAQFADDLLALLELRPISARPPGFVRRAMIAARRRPVLSTSLLIVGVAVIVAVSLWVVGAAMERRQRERDGMASLAEARQILRELDEATRGVPTAGTGEGDLNERARRLSIGFRFADEWDELDRERAALHREGDVVDAKLAEALRALDRATDVGVDRAEVDSLRARVYLAGWRLASSAGEKRAAAFYQNRVEEIDRAGRHREELLGLSKVRFETRPVGASIYLFRMIDRASDDASKESRLVPTPRQDGSAAIPPGTLVMRVTRAAPPLLESDLVVEVAGHPIDGSVVVVRGDDSIAVGDRMVAVEGVAIGSTEEASLRVVVNDGPSLVTFDGPNGPTDRECRRLIDLGIGALDARMLAEQGDVDGVVVRDGRRIELHLPPKPPLRPTAAPLVWSDACRVADPVEGIDLREGAWVAMVRADGYHDAVVPFDVDRRAPSSVDVGLVPLGDVPDGFVAVTWKIDGVATPYFVQEHEVTNEQYIPFLNDPEIRSRIDVAEGPIFYPRELDNLAAGGFLGRDSKGRFVARSGREWKTPVVGVTLSDAMEYASWLTRRVAAAGGAWEFSVPTIAEIDAIRKASRRRVFPTGDRFRTQWFDGYFSSLDIELRPALWTPIDEVPPGVFNLAGGVSEWTTDWFDESSRQRITYGGNWLSRDADEFRLDYSGFLTEETFANKWGFRLIARLR